MGALKQDKHQNVQDSGLPGSGLRSTAIMDNFFHGMQKNPVYAAICVSMPASLLIGSEHVIVMLKQCSSLCLQ